MIGGFLDSISEIVAGKIDAGALALENGLATALTLVINFLARFLHLDGITDKIKKAIETIRGKVSAAMDKVVLWIQNMAGKVVTKGKDAISAAKGWVKDLLKVETKFDAEDGSSHQLYFAPEGEQVELMLNPAPAGAFEKWVNSIPLDKDSPQYERKLKKKQNAIKLAAEIKAKRIEMPPANLTQNQKDAWEDKNIKEIRSLVDELSKETGSLFGGDIPECANEINGKVKFGGLKYGYGTSMVAAVLTKKKLSEGTVPGVTSDSYEIINKRKNKDGSYYIKGHLLNRLLGGTGTDWKNLTPLTRKANGDHERIAESRVKKAVQAGNIVYYKVEAIYGRKAVHDRNNKDIDAIMQKEIQIPTQLVAEADLVTVDANEKIKTRTPLVSSGTVIENDITDPPEY
jgi:hypothetical protein